MKIKNRHIFRGYLLAVEHNPVYTIGIRTKMYDSEEDEKKLRNLGAEFHRYEEFTMCLLLGKLKQKDILKLKTRKYLHSSSFQTIHFIIIR